MKTVRYPAEFKAEAVKQVTERVMGWWMWSNALACRTKASTCGYAFLSSSKALAVATTHPSRQKCPDSRRSLKGPTRSVIFLKKGRHVLCQAVRVKVSVYG